VSAAALLDALHNQASQLRHCPATSARLRRWAAAHPPLERFADVAALEAAVHDRTTTHADVDAVYAALLAVHHNDDTLAGQIILALLLPAIDHRYRRRVTNREDWLAQLITELWQTIRDYPLQRRRRAIPANLIRDASQRTHRALSTLIVTTNLPDTVAEPAGNLAYDRACDRIDLQRAAQDINVSIDDLELLATTRVAGLRITDLATGTNADRLRQRRHRAERRLRNHIAT
jgi:hypothetical protein